LYSVGSISKNKKEYIELEVKESKIGRLRFLLVMGADICRIKEFIIVREQSSIPNKG
jgi:hypothetical protein